MEAIATAGGGGVVVLRDYQQRAVESVMMEYWAGVKRQLLVMATGSGKTATVAHIPSALDLWPMLAFVDREELVDQNAQALQRVNPNRKVTIEQADRWAEADADIVVACTPTIGKKQRDGKYRMEKWAPDHFKMVWVDECHHALAPTSLGVLRYFKPELLVGCSATPWHGSGKPLSNLFDKVVADFNIRWCIQNDWLCDVRAVKVTSAVDLSNIHARLGDFQVEQLAQAVNTDFRNSLIISAIEDHAQDRKSILVFCVGKSHAESLTKSLRDSGFATDVVLDHTPKQERRKIFKDFRSGALRILVGVGVFLEGFDAPNADCAVLARPTQSLLVYTQMVGRILRPSPNKQDALIIDIADNCGKHKVVDTAEVFGLRNMDLLGLSPLEAEAIIEKAAKAGVNVADDDNIGDVLRKLEAVDRLAGGVVKIDTIAEAVDVFEASLTSPDVEKSSMFPWMKISDWRYALRVGNNKIATMFRDPLGKWQMTDGTRTEYLSDHLKPPFKDADKFAKRWMGGPKEWNMRSMDARWRHAEPSEGQRRELGKYFALEAIPKDLTRGSASTLIDFCNLSRRMREQN